MFRAMRAGELLLGKYRVERRLGSGGMAMVFLAKRLADGGRVAIKMMGADTKADEAATARFVREARAGAFLRGPNTTRILDLVRAEDGAPLIVMDYVDGKTLHAVTRERGRLPHHDAVEYILQACSGLAEAHALGMVHRDVKLGNLMVTKDARGQEIVKVLDFGLVKIDRDRLGVTAPTLTGSAEVLGSLRYMAPEQLHGSPHIDARTDIWGLGVCLFYLLTNRFPFVGDVAGTICNAILTANAPRVDELLPGVPKRLADVIARMLEKDPARRFADVGEVAMSLAPFAREKDRIAAIGRILARGKPTLKADDFRNYGLQRRATLDESFEPPTQRLSPPPRPRRTSSFGQTLAGLAVTMSAALLIALSFHLLSGR